MERRGAPAGLTTRKLFTGLRACAERGWNWLAYRGSAWQSGGATPPTRVWRHCAPRLVPSGCVTLAIAINKAVVLGIIGLSHSPTYN